jgi:hypothetical protein
MDLTFSGGEKIRLNEPVRSRTFSGTQPKAADLAEQAYATLPTVQPLAQAQNRRRRDRNVKSKESDNPWGKVLDLQ